MCDLSPGDTLHNFVIHLSDDICIADSFVIYFVLHIAFFILYTSYNYG